ncbi:MAG: 3-deoxy-manno-octulosonate cytidylyltransferase [Candidatus Omnitrophica bacterium]|nr:3-deoxy-manno-octulosonate cytidylyltransferase [Candidatus Omnitrophota bacterium]MCM8826087.1 3-deoxy-manno-octulosonate cytidylyltransferase [Candidatus Omnitrophota bacterium]
MNVIGVIPARLRSTRLPNKLIRKILGKPIIQWTWERAKQSILLDRLVIACDSEEIESIAKGFGGEVIFTSPEHISGTDRIAEVVREIDVKIVINIQGDEPLIHPSVIDELASCMLQDKTLVMATVKKRIENDEEISDPNVVKVVTDKNNFALYFSRFPIPYNRDRREEIRYYKHIGIYAYTKDFLYTFKNLPKSYLEEREKLEQLRAIEAGYKIKVIETNFDSYGIDVEEDLEKVEKILRKELLPPKT